MDDTFTKEDIAALNENRASMYSFLSKFYEIEADKKFIDTLNAVLQSRKEINDDFSADFSRLEAFITSGIDNFYDELAADYAKVFLGIGSKQSEGAFPYESVYTSARGLLMQEARDEVLAIYRENGFIPDEKNKVPEDHLFIELQFMAILADQTAKAVLDEDDKKVTKLLQIQSDFIKVHFNRWIFRFCSEINDVASTDYYKAVADITAKFIKSDEEILDDVLSVCGKA